EQYYGTGRRKEAVARVFLRPGNGKVTVNGQDFNEYFQGLVRAVAALEPLRAVDALGRFDAYITVRGGGKSGQIDAIKLGIARALVQYNPDYRAKLKPLGFLTRDARVVERKKYGKHKARRAPQYSKR
nr:Chain G, 30S ribosomal protein S9 [Thermus thermophilus HB27]4GKJ_I Chain I, 30S ribosomal protein S9 [Thermus thermophilus HB8]4GKK_I Chain I, 30S ribosomal protein S9 [Thermus thermophilus HB8]4JV5_I Chain I, 30S ribosomal protein S9 [Thermus thermophilus HB8]4JYA_I Chain I, 30S ribosomal protein S9 [Thermus thermophilus HB8]4K0K_I Chain I, 30S ribosomal protein S9 [Thermus thermophilus HB8]4KHP_I Chain I, 30S Ribosomal protein S9 [Thermus thermophilus HB8]4V49_AI Chain AI, 30S ribosoma